MPVGNNQFGSAPKTIPPRSVLPPPCAERTWAGLLAPNVAALDDDDGDGGNCNECMRRA